MTYHPTVVGTICAFLLRRRSRSGDVWTDGNRLESNRIVLGKWIAGEKVPRIRRIEPKDIEMLADPRAERTVRKQHRWYQDLVNYTNQLQNLN